MKIKLFLSAFFYFAFSISCVFSMQAFAQVDTTKMINQVDQIYADLYSELELVKIETGDQKLIARLKINALLTAKKEVIGALLMSYQNDKNSIQEEKLSLLLSGIKEFLKREQRVYHYIELAIKDDRRSMGKLSGNELLLKEVEVADKETSLDLLLESMHSTMITLKVFNVYDEQVRMALVRDAKRRAIEASLLLNYTGTEHQVLSFKVINGSEIEKKELGIALRRLEIKKESASHTLKIAIEILDYSHINVDNYGEVLIANVGAEGDDIFEITIISRLINNWIDLFLQWLSENVLDYVINLLIFCLILGVFYIFSNIAKNVVAKATKTSKLNFSKLLRKFIITMTGRIILFIGFLVAFSYVGIELAPLLTGFGVAGIVIGFALQGTLSNFASGVMMLLYRPFDVGDMILAGGEKGTVEKLSLVNTTIHTIDNRRVVLPNNLIWEGTITNISAENLRRVDLTFGIGYGDDLLLAEKVMMDEVTKHSKVLGTPEAIVKVAELGDSSVNFWVRPWVENEDYWDVHWDLTKAIKLRLDKEGITIPFPQRDVHIYSTEKPLVISKTTDGK